MNPGTTPPRSGLDWCLEAVSALSIVGAGTDIASRWSTLPQRIPTHFDLAGHPNGWGGKDSLLVLLAATATVAVALTIAESQQRLINIPVRVDREAPAVRALLRSMVIALKAVILLGFLGISGLTIRIAQGEAAGLGRMFLPAFLGAIAASVIYYTARLKRL